jgi:peptidoglycan/LPS O-acetylase OafA/YrhL
MFFAGVGGAAAAAVGALAAIDLRYYGGPSRTASQVLVLAADALVLVVGAWWLHWLNPLAQAPRIHMALQGGLAIAACLLGAHLAARWFVEDRVRGRPHGFHSPAGIAALLTAVAVSVIGRDAGVALGIAAVGGLGVVWAVLPLLGSRGLRRIRFGTALVLLWAGAFGLYLMVLPTHVVVATAESPSGVERASATGWVVAGLLVVALAAGFMKPRRGSRT